MLNHKIRDYKAINTIFVRMRLQFIALGVGSIENFAWIDKIRFLSWVKNLQYLGKSIMFKAPSAQSTHSY